VVWAIESVSHNDDFGLFLKESRRLLKNEGRLVIADYYRSQRNFQGEEKLLHEKILKGLAFATFNFEPGLRERLAAQGFGVDQFIDVTEKTLPSARLMNYYAGIGLTIGKVLGWLRLRDRSLSRFAEGAQGQYQALNERMHMYKILLAHKES